MNDQEHEAFESWHGDFIRTNKNFPRAEDGFRAALAWLRSQGEPKVWEIHTGPSRFYTRDKEEAGHYTSNLYDVTPLFLAPQPAIPDGWQPIETAPKDFEPFDVWSVRHGRIPDCVDGVTTYGKKRGIVFQSGYDSDGPVMDLIEDATHWMRVSAPEPRK